MGDEAVEPVVVLMANEQVSRAEIEMVVNEFLDRMAIHDEKIAALEAKIKDLTRRSHDAAWAS